MVMFLLGLIIGGATVVGPITIGDVTFDVDTLVAAGGMVVIGFQSVLFWLFTRVYASSEGFLPESPSAAKVLARLSLERVLILGGIIGLAGLVGLISSLTSWQAHAFGQLDYEHALRVMVPSVIALMLSCQAILACFFLSILDIRPGQAHHDECDVPTDSSDERAIARSSITVRRRPAEEGFAMGTAMSLMLLGLRTIATAKETSATLGPRRENFPALRQREPSTAVNPPGGPATLACWSAFSGSARP